MKTSTVSTSQTSCSNSQPKMLNLIKKSALLSKQYEKLLVKNLIGANKYSLDKPSFWKPNITKCLKIKNFCINMLEQKMSG